ncbi:MAG: polysaccharide deacetylase family protein [Candidatus Omnitrophica bacterium]|nr:polysaccharide deacetylase family protein [Candidatus Omnitrophota bacterium]
MENTIELRVCLIENSQELASILRQRGIIFVQEELKNLNKISGFATVIINERLRRQDFFILKEFLLKGGAVILDCENKKFPKSIGAREINDPSLDLLKEIRLFKLEKGYLLSVDADFKTILLNTQSCNKQLITSAGIIHERLAKFPKSKIAELVFLGIALAHSLRELPFVWVWYYPKSYSSVFNLRFDLDEDTEDDLFKTAEVSAEYKDCTTWFVCGYSFEKKSYKIMDMIRSGYDIESHGYYHHTYKDARQNELNFKKQSEYLKQFNLAPDGFAAPKGFWNPGLQDILEKRRFLYSSEFSFDYDNFPLFPYINGKFSKVLQIPVHPVCWGLFSDANIHDHAAITDYFKNVMKIKFESSLPILLYAHPNEARKRDPRLLLEIYEYMSSLKGVWRQTLSGFAKWWKKRDLFSISRLEYSPGTGKINFIVNQGCDFQDVSLCIYKGENACFLTEIRQPEDDIFLQSQGTLKNITNQSARLAFFEEREYSPGLFRQIKERIVGLLDWEENTPTEQIYKGTPRGMIKYVLRNAGLGKIKLPF